MQTVGRKSAGITIVAMLFISTIGGQHAFAGPVQKKVIYYGFGTRDTMYVRDHWQEMEKLPLDGVVISVAIDRAKPTSGDGATENLMGWHLFGPTPFKPEAFQMPLADLKTPKWSKFRSNFLIASVCSADQDHGFDWFDDKRWDTVLNNWKLYAKLAKDSGCKGIIMDVEQYGGNFPSYNEMKSRGNRSFDELSRKVHQRGRELMQVTAKVFPDIQIPMMFTPSYVWYAMSQDPSKPLEVQDYALLPAFMDGMLIGSDKRTRFIDFSEAAYGTMQHPDFLQWYHYACNKALEQTSVPEIYRARVSVGLPIWIDCRHNDKKWDTADFSENYYTPEALKTTLTAALDVTDEYVWIYSEHDISLFPVGNLPEAYIDAIREAHP